MAKTKDIDYAYPVAKVRAVESTLLDRLKLTRMADAQSFQEAVKILKENGYEGDDEEEMLSGELQRTVDFLKGISPSRGAFDLFLVKHDYHNIKVLLKAEFLGKDYDHLLVESGRYPAQLMKNIVTNRAFSDFPQVMKNAVEEAVDLFHKTGDPQLSDLVLDKAAFREMEEMAEQTGSDYVRDIVATMADLANIRIFVRVRRMGRGVDFLMKALLDGGKLKPSAYLREGGASIGEILKSTPYEALLEQGEGITELEKAVDNFLIAYIKKAKFVSFGIEPLVAYLIAKENEIKLVRIILTGKKNGLPPELIKERLRDSYV